MKRLFTNDEIRPVINGNYVHKEFAFEKRWTIVYQYTFALDGKLWQIYFEEGATEAQDYDDFDWMDEFEGVEVEAREVLVTRYLPVEDD